MSMKTAKAIMLLPSLAFSEKIESRVDNIKTTLYNNIDITNIVELTQAEYDVLVANGEINEEVIYLITDETINLKTINGESIIGDGDITIEIPDYSQDINDIKGQLGDIETILNNIIGNN